MPERAVQVGDDDGTDERMPFQVILEKGTNRRPIQSADLRHRGEGLEHAEIFVEEGFLGPHLVGRVFGEKAGRVLFHGAAGAEHDVQDAE